LAKPLAIDPNVLRRMRSLPESDKRACLLALLELNEVFGRAHGHSGVGIRKLGGKLFECRAGLALRFVFQDRPTGLFVVLLGSHDEVREFLRGGREAR
jgi:hypothetical protein